MAYQYTRSHTGLGSLGYSYPRGACSQVAQGESRCFRPSEVSVATRAGCLSTGDSCEVGGASGVTYCCHPGTLIAAPPGTTPTPTSASSAVPSEAESGQKGVWETITEWFTETGERVTDRPAPAGVNKGNGNVTANGFAAHASDAAATEAARAEMQSLPIEDETQAPWFQRYQTHITIASTIIGLGAFIGWVYLKDK